MTELTIKEKSFILYRNGFLRYEDRHDPLRVASRWIIYQTVPQKIAKGNRSIDRERGSDENHRHR